jgi:ubiquinone/menaquinone biosynthesis C-methylase UbiE
MAALLETWGEGNAWHEIALLLAGRRGRVLDIACGTGVVMERLGRPGGLELHGCDISEVLLGKARARGLSAARLVRSDATALPYAADAFDYAYTIGSLEHFTEEGIDRLLAECDRVTRGLSFHMIPISRSGRDEGWIRRLQSYYNNGPEWWLARFGRAAREVHVLPSLWEDGISVGRWVVCRHGAEPARDG